MQFFSIRLSAPMMALTGPKIDDRPMSSPIPTASMITGLFGAALGVERGEVETLQALQDAMQVAAVVHEEGIEMVDYQTADLSKPHMVGPFPAGSQMTVERAGGKVAREGRRQVLYPYRCGADLSVVVQWDDDIAPVTIEEIGKAIEQPVFAIVVGRTCCPPDEPVRLVQLQAESLAEAVTKVPDGKVLYLPSDTTEPTIGDLFIPIYGRRDWHGGKHGGEEVYIQRSAS